MLKKIEYYSLLIIVVLILYRVFIGLHVYLVLRILMTLMAVFYLWSSLFLFNKISVLDIFDRVKRQKLNRFNISSSLVAGFVYSFSVICITFALEFYANMQNMLLAGLVLNGVFLGASLLLAKIRKGSLPYYRQFISRSTLLFLILFTTYLVPVEKRLNLLFSDHPSFVEAYKTHMDNPESEEYLQNLRNERSAFR